MKIKEKRYLRLAIAQINTCVGDFQGNLQKITSCIDQARAKSCDIVSFPELAICGYPPEDLLFKKSFVRENLKSLEAVKVRTGRIVAIVGFVDAAGGRLFNSAAVLADKRIIDVYHKKHLPNYGVFDEKRYFSEGGIFSLYQLYGICLGVNICEDIWALDSAIQAQGRSGAGLVLTINASPYHVGKAALRQKVLKQQARQNNVCISYANLVGGQDELVFDGQSMFVSARGEILSAASAFSEELCIFDLDLEKIPRKKLKPKKVRIIPIKSQGDKTKSIFGPRAVLRLDQDEEVFKALVVGVGDYVWKNGFSKVVLGLSGGIDSSLVAAIARDALGRENVIGVILPSKFNSSDSYEDALCLVKNLGIECKIISIQEIFEEYLRILGPDFSFSSWSVAQENLQARIRGNILMALSNKFGWLVLATGNKSEMGVGYATLYGDMAGGFAAIKDVPKTLVYKLAEFYNRQAREEIIPRRVFTKAPTAELKENQKDTDSLPEYSMLDPILKSYVEENMSASQIIKLGFSQEAALKTIQMVDRSEYKRRQSPPGVKITPRAFGRDRRMPITNKFKEII